MPPSGGILSMSHWEETLRQTQNLLKRYMFSLAWEHCGIPQEEVGIAAGVREVWVSLCCLCDLSNKKWTWMDK